MSAWRSASLKSRATPRRGDQPAFPDSAVACRPRDTRTRNPSDEPEGVMVATWEYHVEQINISERWSAKRQQEEVSYESVPVTGNFTGNVKGYAYLTFFKRQTS